VPLEWSNFASLLESSSVVSWVANSFKKWLWNTNTWAQDGVHLVVLAHLQARRDSTLLWKWNAYFPLRRKRRNRGKRKSLGWPNAVSARLDAFSQCSVCARSLGHMNIRGGASGRSTPYASGCTQVLTGNDRTLALWRLVRRAGAFGLGDASVRWFDQRVRLVLRGHKRCASCASGHWLCVRSLGDHWRTVTVGGSGGRGWIREAMWTVQGDRTWCSASGQFDQRVQSSQKTSSEKLTTIFVWGAINRSGGQPWQVLSTLGMCCPLCVLGLRSLQLTCAC
jgi:hypothetical protein